MIKIFTTQASFMKHLYPTLLGLMILLTPTLASDTSHHVYNKALEQENIARIQSLIAFPDLDVNLQDEFGSTALMLAIDQNHIILAEQLVKRHDTDVNIQNEDGYTALMFTIDRHHIPLAEQLLQRDDMDINKQDINGYTAFMLAVEAYDIEIIEKLLKHDSININKQDINGYTALMLAIIQDHVTLAEQLLKRDDMHVNKQNSSGHTALMLAIIEEHITVVELLLQRDDLDVNLQDKDEDTALMRASACGNLKIAELLLKHQNIQVNQKNEEGDTALMRASVCGHIKMVELLLTHKDMQVNQKNEEGDTALMLAVGLNYIDIATHLLKRHDIDVNLQDVHAYTVLMFAIEENHIPLAELLLQRDDLDVNLQDCEKKTALAYIQDKHIDLNKPQSDNLYYVNLAKRTHLPSLDKEHALLQPTYLQALYAQQPFSHAIKQYIDILLINKLSHGLEEKQKSIFYQGCLIAYESKNSNYSIHAKGIDHPRQSSYYQPLLDEAVTNLLAGYLRSVKMKGVSHRSDWVHLVKCYMWSNNQFAVAHHPTTMTLQEIHGWHTNNSPYTEFLDVANHTQKRALFKVVHQEGNYEATVTKHLARGLKQVGIIQEEKEILAKFVTCASLIIVTGLKNLTYQLAP